MVAVVSVLLLTLAPRAEAYIYFADGGVISRANTNGKQVQGDFIGPSAQITGAVAIDGAHVYFENGDDIGRANLDGSDVDQHFINIPGNTEGLSGLAVGDGYVFWINDTTEAIGRANVNGTGVDQSLVPGLSTPCGLAVSPGAVYWGEEGGDVGRADINGSGANASFIPANNLSGCGVAVDSTYVYWFDGGDGGGTPSTIGRATLAGTGVNQSFVVGIPAAPGGLAVSPSNIYWSLAASGQIGSSTINGTDVNDDLISAGTGGDVQGVSVNALSGPTLAKSANAYPVKGTVEVRVRGSHSFVPLSAARSIPLGSTVDATSGTVSLQTATSHGKVQTAEFYDGQFLLTQARDGLVSLKLNATLSCGPRKGTLAVTARKKPKKKRILWGDGHGGYRTVGGYGAGTVLGTKWETIDSCSETQFKVAEGEIKVTDFRRHKTVVVKAPHSYVARP
jgi:hypothetical protein